MKNNERNNKGLIAGWLIGPLGFGPGFEPVASKLRESSDE